MFSLSNNSVVEKEELKRGKKEHDERMVCARSEEDRTWTGRGKYGRRNWRSSQQHAAGKVGA